MTTEYNQGGSYASSLTAPGAPEGLFLEIAYGSIVAHTFTSRPRVGSASIVPQFGIGEVAYFDDSIASVDIDALDANVSWRWTRTPGQLTGGGTKNVRFGTAQPVKPQPYSTVVDFQAVGPASIANGTAETVEKAGAVAVAIGNRVTFRLAMSGVLTTAADQGTYIALKGHTSGTYYAVCYNGEVSGSFDFPNSTTEKIDIVVANADTIAHNYAGTWEAMTP